MPAVLTVSVRAVVVLHRTDGETEAQRGERPPPHPQVTQDVNPGGSDTRLAPAHTSQQGPPPPPPQSGADTVSALPPRPLTG